MIDASEESADGIGIEVSGNALKAICLRGGRESGYIAREIDNSADISLQVVDFISGIKEGFGEFGRIGIAVSGLINRESNRVVLSARNPDHAEIDLAGVVKKALGLDVVLENDANSAAYGEFMMGAGRGCRNLFYATIGEGVGGAAFLDGKLWRGANGFAGEFGHILIDSEGTKLESVASSEGIIRRVSNRLIQDHSSTLGEIEGFTVADVINEAKNGDGFAEMMLQRTGRFVGVALASVINLLNIERVVLGGEVMAAGGLILDHIISGAREFSFEPSFEAVEIRSDELGEKAPAIGAALLSA